MKKLFYGKSGWIGKQYQVGRYFCTIEDVIAEGGFALVFVVRTGNGQKYALKRVSVNEKVDLKVCKQEIEIMKMLSGHKNSIEFIDCVVNVLQPGIYEVLILMEMCKGGVIDLMNDNITTGFSEKMVLKIFCDTCEVLSLMHHNDPPIIHRDLKVENVLIKECGDFVLCDFGSATTKVMNPSKDDIRQCEDEIQKYTTISYRSPEMIDLYAGNDIDTKSDIWALGCLLYKFCFFASPFGESTLAIQTGNFTFPGDSKYSKELHDLISYTLTLDPLKRPDIYQVSLAAFKIAGLNHCPVTNFKNVKTTSDDISVDSRARLTSPVPPKPVYTTVVPRDRPVATSLAPRQRPKGNNTVVETDEDSAAPFKNRQVADLKNKTNNLRRSHSLKEMSNRQPIVDRNQMLEAQKNLTVNLSQNQLNQQTFLMVGNQPTNIQAQQQNSFYMQQQHQQQFNYYQQQQFLKQQHQQYEFLQQQIELKKQREFMQREQEMRNREMQIKQQKQQLQQQQQMHQQELLLRQRQQEYEKLQNQYESEQHHLEELRSSLSVETHFMGRESPNPFSDDFSRSFPDLSNPFVSNVTSEPHKKTHHRSRSETISKLALKNNDRYNGVHSNVDEGPKAHMSTLPNPFSDELGLKSFEENRNSLREVDDNVGVLLELDDDEHFVRLQKELSELGVVDSNPQIEDISTNKLNNSKISVENNSHSNAYSDDSLLISSVESNQGDRKYVYERTASCSSSSNNSCSSIDDIDNVKTQYCDINNQNTVSGAEVVNTIDNDGSEKHLRKNIFDSAPFVLNDMHKNIRTGNKKTHRTPHPVNSRNMPSFPQKPPTERQDSPFDDQFTSSSNHENEFTSSIRISKKNILDPFGMAPMVKPKTRSSNVNVRRRAKRQTNDPFKMTASNCIDDSQVDSNAGDPFGGAPFVQKNISGDLNVKLPRKKRQLPHVPSSNFQQK